VVPLARFDIVVLSLVCLTGTASSSRRPLADRCLWRLRSFLLLALLTVGLAVVAATWLLRAWREKSGRTA
jgi:hypothetical protein